MQSKQEILIGFAHELVSQVLDGSKTLTYRIGEKCNFLQVGDVIDARDSSNDHIFAKLQITEKSHTTFKDLPIARAGHEGYSSKEEQRKRLEKYYGKVQDNDKVLILGFKKL